MERPIRYLVGRHRELDEAQCDSSLVEREQQQLKTLREKVKKIKRWLQDNDDKPGKSGKPRKSNLTDNESAKMKSAHGVIQGYDGVAAVDAKHQVIVHAEAFGEAQEHDLLAPMVEGTRENFQAIGAEGDIFESTKLTADAGIGDIAADVLFEQHAHVGLSVKAPLCFSAFMCFLPAVRPATVVDGRLHRRVPLHGHLQVE
jgi:hypothetical protein